MKRMFKSRTLIIALLVLAMCLSIAGCTSPASSSTPSSSAPSSQSPSGDPSDPASEEPSGLLSETPVTFTMLYADEATAPYKADWASLVEMTKRTNVTLEMEVVAVSDWDTKLQTVLYSGDLPDIINRCGDVGELALNGKLLAFSDYSDQLPNFNKQVTDNGWEDLIENARAIDGKLYTMPVNTYEARQQSVTLFIAKHVLDDLNLSMPDTFDELYEVLKAVKQANPEVSPWVNKYGVFQLLGAIQQSFDARTDGPTRFTYDKANDEWKLGVTTDNFKELLQYLNKLYAEGILDVEFTTMEDSVMTQRVINGTGIVFTDWISHALSVYPPEGKLNNPDFEIVPVPPLAGPRGTRSLNSATQSNFSICSPITIKDNPNFDVFIKLIDWFYTPDGGADLFSWGIEGVTYEVVDGEKRYLPDILTELNPEGAKELNRDFGVHNNNLSFVYPLNNILAQLSPETQEYMTMLAENNYVPSRPPTLKLSADDQEEIRIATSTLPGYLIQMIELFIMGKESFDDWDKFVQQCDANGAATLTKVYNEAWQRQNGR